MKTQNRRKKIIFIIKKFARDRDCNFSLAFLLVISKILLINAIFYEFIVNAIDKWKKLAKIVISTRR